MPRGGRRPGSGRKKKSDLERAIGGDAGKRGGKVLAHPSSASVETEPAEIEEFDAPDDLTMPERRVWLAQAPHAFKARTLTPATTLAFKRYCRDVVLEEDRARSTDAGDARHMRIQQRVNTFELQFMLTPCGKALFEAKEAKAVNPLDRFVKRAQ